MFAFVFNIGHVSRVVVSPICDNLSSAIGQQNAIRSGYVTLIVGSLEIMSNLKN